MTKTPDVLSLVVIAITFALFSLALFSKGFTHDLLLEAGVLLVSVKSIRRFARAACVSRSDPTSPR